MAAKPPLSVIQAFGLDVTADQLRLEGGQGSSWQVGDAVLKPLDAGAEDAVFVFQLQEQLNELRRSEYRVLEPLVRPAESGMARYVVDGWTGTRFIPGTHALAGRWAEVLSATRAFHRDLKELVRIEPEMFRLRTSPWAVADLIAWDEDGLDRVRPGSRDERFKLLLPSFVDLYDRLVALKRPLARERYTNQLVHLDLMGNILLSDNAPPTIIDLSLYWRPVEYAEAIFVVDGLTDEGASNGILSSLGALDATSFQMLIRAMIFRVVAWSILGLERRVADDPKMATQFQRTCDTIERVFGGHSRF